MRRIIDGDGSAWDVVVGRASWGVFVLLFVPAGDAASRPTRQWMLPVEAVDQAERALAEMDDDVLLERLQEAGPRDG